MTEVQRTTRPGLRTTEFWLALAATALSAAAAIYAEKEWAQVAGIIATALVAGGYGFARQAVKRVEAAGIATQAERTDMMEMQRLEAASGRKR